MTKKMAKLMIPPGQDATVVRPRILKAGIGYWNRSIA